ncbi:hypothetical protein L7F22_020415 [Adiantum nelumboides]|nr:hypothetical protein [Adiantum nelumboides]
MLNKCPSFTLRLENHHQVCLAQMVVQKHFKQLVPAMRSDCVSGSSHDVEIFWTKSKEDLDILKHELELGCDETNLIKAVGFRHVVDALVSARKPLIWPTFTANFFTHCLPVLKNLQRLLYLTFHS